MKRIFYLGMGLVALIAFASYDVQPIKKQKKTKTIAKHVRHERKW